MNKHPHRKKWGQNFIKDENIIKKIIAVINPKTNDRIIEIATIVTDKDLNIIEGMQKGRNSPAYNGGNFSPIMDNATHQFHKWVATNLI